MNSPLNQRGIKIALVALAVFILGIALLFSGRIISSYYLQVAEKAFSDSDFQNAISYSKKSIIFDSKNFKASALLGRAIVHSIKASGQVYDDNAKKLYKESINNFNMALSSGLNENTYPDDRGFLDDYGTAYWRLEEYDKADNIFLEKIKKYPNDAFLARFLITLDYTERTNKPKEARDIILPAFQSLNINHDLLPDAYAVIMRLSTYFENYVDTEKYAKTIMSIAKESNKESLQFAYIHLATVYSKKGDLPIAKSWINKADLLFSPAGHYACTLAHMYYDNGKYDLAVTTAKIIDNPRCWVALSKAYFKLKDVTNAKLYAQKTLDSLNSLVRKDIFAFQGISQMNEILKSI